VRRARREPEDDGYLVTLFDVHEQKAQTEYYSHLARTDTLTNLLNRHGLLAELHRRVSRDAASFVAYVDLDGFKLINDSFGHAVGDSVLREVARRLAAHRPAGATLGRMGGDEFTFLVDGDTEPEALQEAMDELLGALAEPYQVGGQALFLSATTPGSSSTAPCTRPSSGGRTWRRRWSGPGPTTRSRWRSSRS
jgi:diguanylate cyclase (GGDEF)-like protein